MSGRFLFPLLLLVLEACIPGGSGSSEAPGPTEPPEPVVAPGPTTEARETDARELLRAATLAREAGDDAEAARLAGRVVDEYPSSAVSGRALRLRVEAAFDAAQWAVVDDQAETYVSLLPGDDERVAAMRLLQIRALGQVPDTLAMLDRALRVPYSAPAEARAELVEVVREGVRGLPLAELGRLLESTAADAAARPTAEAWYARLLLGAGRAAEAGVVARAALAAGAPSPDSALAAAVLDPSAGPLPPLPGGRTVRIGAVLPLSGSPALREIASLLAEGIEVAASTEDESLSVDLVVRDDDGEPAAAARAVRDLEDEGVLGAVGFLRDESLAAAAEARARGLPLVSPTARTGAAGRSGVLTLSGPDPEAARAMAEYAAREGYVRVAMIHSQVPESLDEADAFEAALRGRGVAMAGRWAYPAGATFFQDQIRAAREALRLREIRELGLGAEDTLRVEELDPVALFVPVPAEDVEFLAPQLTFFGLDTLGIDILGTSGWTDAQTLEAVDDRHTTGVVATAPVQAGPGSRGHRRFREAYEEHFQRTLVSPVPALGWDAALLVLEAARSGARGPAQMQEALSAVEGLEGATGVFSVVDGRVLRRQEIVRIVRGATIPAG